MNPDKPPEPVPAVFLDRDGTINREVEYLSRVSDLELIEGAARAIAMLNRTGFRVAVVTNQSGVARGFLDERKVLEINLALSDMLKKEGAHIDAWYYCPHHPSEGNEPYRTACSCRKPGTGMVEQACQEFPVDLSASFVVGDTLRDMELAWNCGMKAVLVKTGHGMKALSGMDADTAGRLDYIAADLLDASAWICSTCA
jgi:histidinol-phosphate phosphatase family protein